MSSSTGERGIGIVRVSQRDDDKAVSPEVQARALLRQAERDGFGLAPKDIWDENLDDDGRIRPASGGAALAERPRLLTAIEEVEQGRAQVIVAERFDRFFRDLDVQREVIRRVERAGGRLVTAAGEISHATAEDELHANLNGSIAQYTKRTAMERSKAAVQIAIEQGRVPWKDTTPGFDLVNGKLVPNEQAPYVAEAVKMRAKRETIATIREYLADNGIERSYHGVQHLLRSPLLVGEIHFGKYTPNLEAHEPIVEREVWKRAQRVRNSRGRRAKSEALLARLGILRCGTCGSRMVIGQSNHGQYRIYRCPPVGDCARRVTISADIVEEVVRDAVEEAREGMQGVPDLREQVERACAVFERAQEAYESYGQAFSGHEDVQAFKQRLDELKAARDAAADKLEQAEAELNELVVVPIDTPWQDLSLRGRRKLVSHLIEEVRIYPGRGKGRIRLIPKAP